MSDNPKPPDTTPRPQAREANPQQREVIHRLASAIGMTTLANWDAMPTGLTRGLKLSEMAAAAHVHSLARMLAAGVAHVPDGDERLEQLLALIDEILREVFAHEREAVKQLGQPPAPDDDGVTPLTDGKLARIVLVPAPKLLM